MSKESGRWRAVDEEKRRERRAMLRKEFMELRDTLTAVKAPFRPPKSSKAIDITASNLANSCLSSLKRLSTDTVAQMNNEDLLNATVDALSLYTEHIKQLEQEIQEKQQKAQRKKESTTRSIVHSNRQRMFPERFMYQDNYEFHANGGQLGLASKLQRMLSHPLRAASLHDQFFSESEAPRALITRDYRYLDVNDAFLELFQSFDIQYPKPRLRQFLLNTLSRITDCIPPTACRLIDDYTRLSWDKGITEFSMFAVTIPKLVAAQKQQLANPCEIVTVSGGLSLFYVWPVFDSNDDMASPKRSPVAYHMMWLERPNIPCSNPVLLAALLGDKQFSQSYASCLGPEEAFVISYPHAPQVSELLLRGRSTNEQIVGSSPAYLAALTAKLPDVDMELPSPPSPQSCLSGEFSTEQSLPTTLEASAPESLSSAPPPPSPSAPFTPTDLDFTTAEAMGMGIGQLCQLLVNNQRRARCTGGATAPPISPCTSAPSAPPSVCPSTLTGQSSAEQAFPLPPSPAHLAELDSDMSPVSGSASLDYSLSSCGSSVPSPVLAGPDSDRSSLFESALQPSHLESSSLPLY